MKYSLEITQISDGETSRISVQASGAMVDGALKLHYAYDGALYKLSVEKNKITQLRTGEIGLETCFSDGENTTCRLSGVSGGGEFDIFTKRLKVDFDGLNASAECEFSYEEDADTTVLTIAANAVQ